MGDLRPLATFQVGGDPDWMALADDSVWVTCEKTNRVIRLDARTNTVGGFVEVSGPCSGLAVGFGSLWVPSCAGHSLVRIDLTSMKVVATIPARPADSEGGIATGAGSVWMVTASDGYLARIDPSTNKVAASIKIPPGSYAVAFDHGSAWVTSTAGNLLTRVDAATNTVVSTTSVGRAPRFLTVGAGAVWTLNQGDGSISRVDAASGKLVATIQAGLSGHGGEIAYGEGSLWVTLSGFPITKIDPATNEVTQQWGEKVAIAFERVWGRFGLRTWRQDWSGGWTRLCGKSIRWTCSWLRMALQSGIRLRRADHA